MAAHSFVLFVFLLFSFAKGAPFLEADDGDFCNFCQNEITKIEASLGNSTDDQQIVKELDKICDMLPSDKQAECKSIIASIGLQMNTSDYFLIFKYSPNALCAMIGVCQFDCCATPVTPEQIHISTGSDPTQMTITFTTLELLQHPVVQYGLAQGTFTMEINASSHTFTVGGWRGNIYVATLTDLAPGTRYYYQVGDPSIHYWSNPAWSQPVDLNFVTRPLNQSSARLAIFGDMGVTDVSSETILRLNSLVQSQELDFVLHIGDIAYSDGWETLFDEFLRKVETIGAYIPYMTTPGNHELYYNFATYKSRYVMPFEQSNSSDPMYYSFDWGNVHVIAMNTESRLDIPSDVVPGSEQYKWLEADLMKASQNRDKVPWIIVGGHRPFYCVPDSGKDCDTFATYLRDCLEELFFRYKVDLVVTAHMHNYETTYPTYKGKAYPGFTNAQAPVYIVSGAAGNKEHLTGIGQPPYPEWSRYNLAVYGYGLVDAPNSTHFTWSFLSSQTGEVLDTFTLIKD